VARVGLTQALDVRIKFSAIVKNLFGAALLASASACTYQTAALGPELEGTLSVDGNAAQGAEVLVGFSGNHDTPCSGLKPSARTDESGHFHVPARTARLTQREIQAIPYGTTQNYVCFRYKGTLIIDGMILVQPGKPVSYIANCVSPRPPEAAGEDAQVCWWRSRTSNNSFKPKPLRGSA
jgi:hypothetical protein